MIRAPLDLSQLSADAFCYLIVTLARTTKRDKLPDQHSGSCKSLQWVIPPGSLLCTQGAVQANDTDLCGKEANSGHAKTVAHYERFYSRDSCSLASAFVGEVNLKERFKGGWMYEVGTWNSSHS